jgi:hypothetical protein
MTDDETRNSADWEELGQLMSDISEEAYCAGWMDQLEYDLWEAIHGGSRKYGRAMLTDEEVSRLRELSLRLGGWVWFNDDVGMEEFVELERWRVMYEQWFEQRSPDRRP